MWEAVGGGVVVHGCRSFPCCDIPAPCTQEEGSNNIKRSTMVKDDDTMIDNDELEQRIPAVVKTEYWPLSRSRVWRGGAGRGPLDRFIAGAGGRITGRSLLMLFKEDVRRDDDSCSSSRQNKLKSTTCSSKLTTKAYRWWGRRTSRRESALLFVRWWCNCQWVDWDRHGRYYGDRVERYQSPILWRTATITLEDWTPCFFVL